MKRLVAFVWGVVFGAGVGLAGLARPDVILGYLDVTGAWDPSLLVTMATAIATYAIGHALVRRRGAPLYAPALDLPKGRRIDGKLVVGATVFGLGWGIAGMCPGATLVALGQRDPRSLAFVAALGAGMALYSVVGRLRAHAVAASGAALAPPERS